MRAMILERPGTALRESEVVKPSPGTGQVLVRVLACAVCRTDLHVVDGELPDPKLPLIPGHEIVGEIVECGSQVALGRTKHPFRGQPDQSRRPILLEPGTASSSTNRNTIILDVERQRSVDPFAFGPDPRRRRARSELVK